MAQKDNTTVHIQFKVRVFDGMKWLRELARDPSLANEWEWYPTWKTVMIDGKTESFVDTYMSGSTAWKDQVCGGVLHLSYTDRYAFCIY